jgi:hypothetical protein
MSDALYTVTAIVGCGLIAASLLGVLDGDHGVEGFDGAHGVDGVGGVHGFDHHIDQTVDAGHSEVEHSVSGHGDGLHNTSVDWVSWIPLLSLRFWIFSSAAFGLIGVLLGAINKGSDATRFVAALVGGSLTGTVVWALFRYTRRLDQTDGASVSHLSGQQARVVVPINGTTAGKVRLQVQGQTVELLAKAEPGVVLEIDANVFIVSMTGTFADVIPTAQLESNGG